MRLRLIASFVLIVLVTIGVVMVVLSRQTAQEIRNFMYRGGLTGGEQVVRALEEHYAAHRSWEGAEEILLSWRRMGGHGAGFQGHRQGEKQGVTAMPFGVRLADAQGNLISGTLGADTTGQLTSQELERAIPLQVDGEVVGYLAAQSPLSFTQDSERALLARLNRTAALSAAIAGGIAVVLALFLSHRLIRPVLAMTQAATRMAEGDLSQRVPVQGNDELATLGRTFNHMAESLQQAEESRKALTADIAHELRTPLAVQLAHLEALQDGIYDLTLENLAPIEEQNRLLRRLVDDLRTLALADAGRLNLERALTDLTALTRRVVERFEPQAGEAQIGIDLALEESCPPLSLDALRIEQILHNLLSNALRHTPPGGRIECRLRVLTEAGDGATPAGRPAPAVVVEVRDTGPGIPPEALPHIFDRFYRADKSRSRAEGGTGIGLSIARKLAQAHGGDLTASNHPDGGALFSLWLPLTNVQDETA